MVRNLFCFSQWPKKLATWVHAREQKTIGIRNPSSLILRESTESENVVLQRCESQWASSKAASRRVEHNETFQVVRTKKKMGNLNRLMREVRFRAKFPFFNFSMRFLWSVMESNSGFKQVSLLRDPVSRSRNDAKPFLPYVWARKRLGREKKRKHSGRAPGR